MVPTQTKTFRTLLHIKRTAQHHYGGNTSSLIKFMYYSGLRRNTFVVYGLDLSSSVRPHELDDAIRVITPNLEELDSMRLNRVLPREFYYDKMHGVKDCYVAVCKNELAYIHWVYLKGDPNRFLKLSEGVAELNYNTTLPQFRGKGLMGKMMAYISQELKNRGYGKVVGVINQTNYSAVKNALWAGWKEMGKIKTVGPFNGKIEV